MLKFGNSFVNFGGTYLKDWVDPHNPLNLPPNTIRVRTSNGDKPKKSAIPYDSANLVSGTSDVYDVYKSGNNFMFLFENCSNLVEVLGANIKGVTYLNYMFSTCNSLTTVNLFDTSTVTDMTQMFSNCTSLTYIPLFNTSNVTDMSQMFVNCTNVQSGALALYKQASTQASIPYHSATFRSCGSNTQTGQAELAQIPSDWK